VASKQRGIATTLILYGIGAAVAIGAVYFVWQSMIAEPYREQGRIEVRANLEPKISALTDERNRAQADRDQAIAANRTLEADVADLRGRVDEQTKAIRRYQAAVAAAKAETARIRAEAAKKAAAAADEIARLTALAAGPPVAEACQVADRILSELAEFVRLP
jgi:hypothetical protein